MASNFLNNLAEQRAEKVDREVGTGAYGGTDWLKGSKATAISEPLSSDTYVPIGGTKPLSEQERISNKVDNSYQYKPMAVPGYEAQVSPAASAANSATASRDNSASSSDAGSEDRTVLQKAGTLLKAVPAGVYDFFAKLNRLPETAAAGVDNALSAGIDQFEDRRRLVNKTLDMLGLSSNESKAKDQELRQEAAKNQEELRQDAAKFMDKATSKETLLPTEWTEQTQKEIQSMGKVGQFAGQLLYSAGQIVPTAALSVATGSPASGLSAMGLNVYNNSSVNTYNSLVASGMEKGEAATKAATKGLTDALIEVGTEVLVGGTPTVSKGLLDPVYEEVAAGLGSLGAKLGVTTSTIAALQKVATAVSTGMLSPAGQFVYDLAGEGIEEWVSEFITPYVDRSIVGLNTPNSTSEERALAFLGGVITSGLFKGASAATQLVVNGGGQITIDNDGNLVVVKKPIIDITTQEGQAPAVTQEGQTTSEINTATQAENTTTYTPQTEEAKQIVEQAKAIQLNLGQLTEGQNNALGMLTMIKTFLVDGFGEGGSIVVGDSEITTRLPMEAWPADMPEYTPNLTTDQIVEWVDNSLIPTIKSYNESRGTAEPTYQSTIDEITQEMYAKPYSDLTDEEKANVDNFYNSDFNKAESIPAPVEAVASTKEQRAAIKSISDGVAKLGLKASAMTVEQQKANPNKAAVIDKNGNVRINPKYANSRAALSVVMAHELVHNAQQTGNSANITTATKWLMKQLGLDFEATKNEIRAIPDYAGLSDAQLNDEVSARFLGYALGSDYILKNIAAIDTSALKSMDAFINDLIEPNATDQYSRGLRRIQFNIRSMIDGTFEARQADKQAALNRMNGTNNPVVEDTGMPKTADTPVLSEEFVLTTGEELIDKNFKYVFDSNKGQLHLIANEDISITPEERKAIVDKLKEFGFTLETIGTDEAGKAIKEFMITDPETALSFLNNNGVTDTNVLPQNEITNTATAMVAESTSDTNQETKPYTYKRTAIYTIDTEDPVLSVLNGWQVFYNLTGKKVVLQRPGNVKSNDSIRAALKALGAFYYRATERDSSGKVKLGPDLQPLNYSSPFRYSVRGKKASTAWAKLGLPELSSSEVQDSTVTAQSARISKPILTSAQRRAYRLIEQAVANTYDEMVDIPFGEVVPGTVLNVRSGVAAGKPYTSLVLTTTNEGKFKGKALQGKALTAARDLGFNFLGKSSDGEHFEYTRPMDTSLLEVAKRGNFEALKSKMSTAKQAKFDKLIKHSANIAEFTNENGRTELFKLAVLPFDSAAGFANDTAGIPDLTEVGIMVAIPTDEFNSLSYSEKQSIRGGTKAKGWLGTKQKKPPISIDGSWLWQPLDMNAWRENGGPNMSASELIDEAISNLSESNLYGYDVIDSIFPSLTHRPVSIIPKGEDKVAFVGFRYANGKVVYPNGVELSDGDMYVDLDTVSRQERRNVYHPEQAKEVKKFKTLDELADTVQGEYEVTYADGHTETVSKEKYDKLIIDDDVVGLRDTETNTELPLEELRADFVDVIFNDPGLREILVGVYAPGNSTIFHSFGRAALHDEVIALGTYDNGHPKLDMDPNVKRIYNAKTGEIIFDAETKNIIPEKNQSVDFSIGALSGLKAAPVKTNPQNSRYGWMGNVFYKVAGQEAPVPYLADTLHSYATGYKNGHVDFGPQNGMGSKIESILFRTFNPDGTYTDKVIYTRKGKWAKDKQSQLLAKNIAFDIGYGEEFNKLTEALIKAYELEPDAADNDVIVGVSGELSDEEATKLADRYLIDEADFGEYTTSDESYIPRQEGGFVEDENAYFDELSDIFERKAGNAPTVTQIESEEDFVNRIFSELESEGVYFNIDEIFSEKTSASESRKHRREAVQEAVNNAAFERSASYAVNCDLAEEISQKFRALYNYKTRQIELHPIEGKTTVRLETSDALEFLYKIKASKAASGTYLTIKYSPSAATALGLPDINTRFNETAFAADERLAEAMNGLYDGSLVFKYRKNSPGETKIITSTAAELLKKKKFTIDDIKAKYSQLLNSGSLIGIVPAGSDTRSVKMSEAELAEYNAANGFNENAAKIRELEKKRAELRLQYKDTRSKDVKAELTDSIDDLNKQIDELKYHKSAENDVNVAKAQRKEAKLRAQNTKRERLKRQLELNKKAIEQLKAYADSADEIADLTDKNSELSKRIKELDKILFDEDNSGLLNKAAATKARKVVNGFGAVSTSPTVDVAEYTPEDKYKDYNFSIPDKAKANIESVTTTEVANTVNDIPFFTNDASFYYMQDSEGQQVSPDIAERVKDNLGGRDRGTGNLTVYNRAGAATPGTIFMVKDVYSDNSSLSDKRYVDVERPLVTEGPDQTLVIPGEGYTILETAASVLTSMGQKTTAKAIITKLNAAGIDGKNFILALSSGSTQYVKIPLTKAISEMAELIKVSDPTAFSVQMAKALGYDGIEYDNGMLVFNEDQIINAGALADKTMGNDLRAFALKDGGDESLAERIKRYNEANAQAEGRVSKQHTVDEINVPKGSAVSQTFEKMIQQEVPSEGVIAERIDAANKEGFALHEILKDKEVVKYAKNEHAKYNGDLDTEFIAWKDKIANNDPDMLKLKGQVFTLTFDDAIVEALEEATANGDTVRAQELYKMDQEVMGHYFAVNTVAAQTLRGVSFLKLLMDSPAGVLYYSKQWLNRMQLELSKKAGKEVKLAISPEIEGKLSSSDKNTRYTGMQELASYVALNTPKTFMDKVDAWRLTGMLTSPVTYIRNAASNALNNVNYIIKGYVNGAIEDKYDSKDRKYKFDNRTYSFKNSVKATASEAVKADWQAAIDFVKARAHSAEIIARAEANGNKYQDFNVSEDKATKGTLDQMYHANLNPFDSKPLNAAYNKVFSSLQGADTYGLKGFVNSIPGLSKAKFTEFGGWISNYEFAFLQAMRSNDWTTDFFMESADPNSPNQKAAQDALTFCDEQAVKEADKATYHSQSQLASWINEARNWNTASKILLGSLIPYTKTPINVGKSALQFSPLSFGKAVSEFRNIQKMGDYSTYEINSVIDRIGSGLTGSMIWMLGFALARAGILTASSSDDDKDVEAFRESTGTQPYSINILDKGTYTIDWVTPESITLFMGAEFYKEFMKSSIEGDEMNPVNSFIGAMKSMVGKSITPILDLSFMEGVANTIEAGKYGQNTADSVMSIGESLATGYAKQFIPTVIDKISTAIDPTVYSTYSPSDSDVPFGQSGEQFLRQLENKSDIVSRNLLDLVAPESGAKNAASVDMWGNEKTNAVSDSPIANAAYTFLSPGFYKSKSKDARNEALEEIFAETKDSAVLPATPAKYFSVNGRKYIYDNQEYHDASVAAGKAKASAVDEVLASDMFNTLSSDEKAEVIAAVYKYGDNIAKDDYFYKNGISWGDSSNIKKELNKIKTAQDTGLSVGEYYIIQTKLKAFDKKDDKRAYLRSIGLSYKQRDVFI